MNQIELGGLVSLGLLLALVSASVPTIAFWECIFAAQRVTPVECVSRDEDIGVGRKQVIRDHIVGLDEGFFLSPWSVCSTRSSR